MISEYIAAAMTRARYEIVADDGSYYGEIPGFEGVWANANTLEGCRTELQEVLESWVLLRIHAHLVLPSVDGRSLRIEDVA